MRFRSVEIVALLFSFLLFLDTCNHRTFRRTIGDAVEIEEDAQWLEEGELITSIGVNKLRLMAKLGGYQRFTQDLNHSISVYKVTYSTPFQGREVIASGLVAIPKTVTSDTPMLVAQNGTIMAHHQAPTSFKPPQRFTGLVLFAAAGYITFIPDYIGFGSSKGITHPYYNYQLTTTAVINMIKAGQELLQKLQVPYSDKIFLFGYSKGGYATMATHKAIEANPQLGLQVSASATGAGSYDLIGVMNHVLAQPSFSAPSFLAFILYSYNQTNNWQRDPEEFFKMPYARYIPQLMNGDYSKAEIDGQLPSTLTELFNPDFLGQLKSMQDPELMEALRTNSVHDWRPLAPLRIYHSPQDEIIPYSDSENTFKHMRHMGAEQVELVPIEGDSHADAAFVMVEEVLAWFKTM